MTSLGKGKKKPAHKSANELHISASEGASSEVSSKISLAAKESSKERTEVAQLPADFVEVTSQRLISIEDKLNSLLSKTTGVRREDIGDTEKTSIRPGLSVRSRQHADVLQRVFTFSPEIKEALKLPTFNNWKYTEPEMIGLMEEMFNELKLVDMFHIDKQILRAFLVRVWDNYNDNPFHNFRHCFCVSQMMYGIIHLAGLVHVQSSSAAAKSDNDKHEGEYKKTPFYLSDKEKLILLVACICHDIDHPGFNNTYQINARTDLAIIYNDQSPLENHHAAVAFAIMNSLESNIFSSIPEDVYKEVRKGVITCILATDMSKHGDILNKFGEVISNFDPSDDKQRTLVLQVIIKCADISNEVRPIEVADPWVDCLLEEFFLQSDRERTEGLPIAPFMDRTKVTKAAAQVNFIDYVMKPLFQQLTKLFPALEAPLLGPIRKAHERYKQQAAEVAAKK